MIDFDYYAPASLDEALFLLKERGGEARVLAGGTDLIVQMKNGQTRPVAVVDVKHIPEMNRLELDGQGDLFVGAAVSLCRIVAFPPVATDFSILHQACSLIGSVQIRNRATLGGNVCNAAPSADSPPALLCLEAKAVLAGVGGSRTVPLEDFFRGPGQTVIAPDELLVGLHIPARAVRSAGCYMRHTPREEMDIAVIGVAVLLIGQGDRCQEARIVLGAVAPTPLRAPRAETVLAGRNLTAETITAAAETAAAAASPISDIRASADYRRELVKVLTRRALEKAWQAL